jgi:uncharacterized membrane protein
MGHRFAVVGLLVMAFVLLVGPAASACTTDDWVRLQAADPAPGRHFQVEGGGFEPGAVELRWNGMQGALLGVAEAGGDGRIVATAVVPQDAVAGRYSVAAVQESADGTRGWAYADLVLATPLPAAEPVTSPPAEDGGHWPYLLVALLAGTLSGFVMLARRSRSAKAARLHAELDRLLEDERTPVHSSGASRT